MAAWDVAVAAWTSPWRHGVSIATAWDAAVAAWGVDRGGMGCRRSGVGCRSRRHGTSPWRRGVSNAAAWGCRSRRHGTSPWRHGVSIAAAWDAAVAAWGIDRGGMGRRRGGMGVDRGGMGPRSRWSIACRSATAADARAESQAPSSAVLDQLVEVDEPSRPVRRAGRARGQVRGRGFGAGRAEQLAVVLGPGEKEWSLLDEENLTRRLT